MMPLTKFTAFIIIHSYCNCSVMFKMTYIKRLSNCQQPKDIVQIFESVYTDTVPLLFNWKGKKGKSAFGKLSAVSIIMGKYNCG